MGPNSTQVPETYISPEGVDDTNMSGGFCWSAAAASRPDISDFGHLREGESPTDTGRTRSRTFAGSASGGGTGVDPSEGRGPEGRGPGREQGSGQGELVRHVLLKGSTSSIYWTGPLPGVKSRIKACVLGGGGGRCMLS